ncbi:[citrate (pro-3S)-lyase] ligase [Orbaceae bacterium ac157xtp]
MYCSLDYYVIDITKDLKKLEQIKSVLQLSNLNLDHHIQYFAVAEDNSGIVACAGIDSNVIKCVAIHPDYRGNNINLTLLDTAIKFANDIGHFHLFLYTKPENKDFFKGCGFYPIVEIENLIVLMENTPVGISRFCEKLSLTKKEGSKIGSIVMNANPFTNGHRYLVECASKQCDWVHLFVVSEDASLFSFQDRIKLVQQGTLDLSNVTVHSSTDYMISKATFPTYFLKNPQEIDRAYMGIDLLIFRNFIAPALNITHRFVGTEPFSEVTNAYNEAMTYWLKDEHVSSYPAIDLIEIERLMFADNVISASRVRHLLQNNYFNEIEKIVPLTTWNYLKNNFINTKVHR